MSVFSRTRLDSEVRALLQERIGAGIYPIGETLPSEVALASELGVSRVTLRQALKSLEEDGVLIKRHGVGTFVNEPFPVLECVLHQNLGVTEMIRRSGLEPGTAEQALIDPYTDETAASILGRGALVALERVRTANGRPIAVTTDVIKRQDVKDTTLFARDNLSIYSLLEELGITIRHGNATLLPTQATAEVAAALAIPVGSVLLMLEQTDFDSRDRPVVFSRELWVRRAIRFVVDRNR